MLRPILFVCVALLSLVSALPVETVDISTYSLLQLEQLKASFAESSWWIEVGDKVLLYEKAHFPYDTIFIVPRVHMSEIEAFGSQVLLHHLGYAIINATESKLKEALRAVNFEKPRKIIQFRGENLVLVRKVENAPLPPVEHVGDARSAPIATLVNYVNQDRWFSDVTTLAGWNRYTRGSQISQAQAWIQSQLAALPNVTVTTQPFTSGTTSGVNVIATITGFATPNNWVIVGGHYDSTSQSPSSAAPGAEDDASGAAAVLEMARVFSQYPPPSTILLMFYSGEEQGLLGSAANAQSIVKNGDASKVKLMHNMDMIAYQTNPSGPKQVILETTSKFASLFPLYRESGTRYTTLGLFESTTAWGSDHESYITRGMPGLLTIDKDWDKYPSYHRTTDTPDKLTPSLGYQIIRLGVGAIAQAAGYTF